MAFGKTDLERVVRTALEEIGAGDISFSVQQPSDISHGDYATNAALIASKKLSISPQECAKKIQASIEGKHEEIAKTEIAGPGFINFFLSNPALQEVNKKNIEKLQTIYTGKDILVEHSSPNLFKPFHVGHLMNNIVGEFVARAMREGGANVKTLSFPSDISLGIAKAIYILKEDKEKGKNIWSGNEGEIIEYLGNCYVRGTKLAEEHPDLDQKIRDLSEELFNQIDKGEDIKTEAYGLYVESRKRNTEYFEHVLSGIGSKIDAYIYESEAGKKGKEIIEEHRQIFQDGDGGSIIYVPDEARKDLNTAVFINREGHPTYEAKDLGLLAIKFGGEYGNADYSFFITDQEQVQHFKIVLDAATKLKGDFETWVAKSRHIPHGRMLFKGEKMSSRLGGVPLALDVISTVEEEAREKAGEKIAHLSEEEKKKLEREIALSALRIAVLRAKPGLNINFDPESSLSFEGDSGPYLLYTHARASSLLDKGKEKGVDPIFFGKEAISLERHMIHAEEVFIKTIEDIAPQQLVAYLFSVAQLFNGWYAEVQIITENRKESAHNLAIVSRVKAILSKGLYLLGVQAPERM